MFVRRGFPILVLFLSLSLAGCESIALTALGVGASAGASHTMNGMVYRTFTEPMPRVRKATMNALNRMAIKVDGTEKTERGEIIRARTADREIEIELEAISPKTTRIRALARQSSMAMDAATATEIVIQTEKVLGA